MEKIYLRTTRYLNSSDFNEYLYLVKRIASWDSLKKAWIVDPDKFSSLTPKEAQHLITRLRELGIEGVEALISLLPRAEGRRVRIEFDGNFVVVKFLHPHIYQELTYSSEPDGSDSILNSLLSYQVKKFDNWSRQFYWQRIRRYWIYFDRLVTFRGLLPRLEQVFNLSGVKWTNLEWREPENVKLRDYQREAVVEAFNQLELCGAATIQAATGSGKTEMAIALWEALGRPKTYFLSLNTDLLIQAKQRWAKYGFNDTGLVNKDNFEIGRNVMFCTVQTLYRAVEKVRKDIKYEGNGNGIDEVLLEERDLKGNEAAQLAADYSKAELVIFDECQHIPARTVWTVLIFHPNSMRVALSATPWRDDGRDLDIYAVAGEPVKRKITSSELCDRGYLVPAEINFVIYRPAWAENFRKRKNTWQVVKKTLFEDEERNRLIARLAKKSPKPVLILVKEIKHGRLIAQECKKLGLKTAFVHGELNPKKRAELLEAGRKGLLDVIVATTLADEGLDWPSLRTLILAGGGKSSTRALQRVGRIVRPFGGKEVGLVWDIWDEVRYFQEHAEARKKIYETENRWRIRFVTAEEALEG